MTSIAQGGPFVRLRRGRKCREASARRRALMLAAIITHPMRCAARLPRRAGAVESMERKTPPARRDCCVRGAPPNEPGPPFPPAPARRFAIRSGERPPALDVGRRLLAISSRLAGRPTSHSREWRRYRSLSPLTTPRRRTLMLCFGRSEVKRQSQSAVDGFRQFARRYEPPMVVSYFHVRPPFLDTYCRVSRSSYWCSSEGG